LHGLRTVSVLSSPPPPSARCSYDVYSESAVVTQVLGGYANYSIPLAHLVLDMNWCVGVGGCVGAWVVRRPLLGHAAPDRGL
jgi:hypothetical protein